MRNPSDLGGRVALVRMGGSLGRAVGDALAASGATAVVVEPRAGEGSWDVDEVVREHGRLDICVNQCRPPLARGPVEDVSAESWAAVMDSLSDAFVVAQTAGRHMLAGGAGVLVNVTSVGALRVMTEVAARNVAEAGVAMMTQALGVEWAARGVRVVGVALASVEGDGSSPDPNFLRRTPQRRPARPTEVAEAICFLASEESSFVTAETLRVDGGWTAYQMF